MMEDDAVNDTNLQPGRVNESLVNGDGNCSCRYYTSQPAPSQWVAVGVTTAEETASSERHRMLVGTGRTETAAVRALRRRCGWTG